MKVKDTEKKTPAKILLRELLMRAKMVGYGE
jgi:hypothetical protein